MEQLTNSELQYSCETNGGYVSQLRKAVKTDDSAIQTDIQYERCNDLLTANT